jgi:hypothetical protein
MSEQEKIVEYLQLKYGTYLLDKDQVAVEAGKISSTSVDRLRQTGALSSRKVLGQVRFSVTEVARFIADA